MSAVGIDFGNENCYIAVARAGGIETISNEYGVRNTPSYVAFGSNSRELGTSAKNKLITNLKDTVYGFKRLVGKKFTADENRTVSDELSYLPFRCNVKKVQNDHIGVKVNHLGNEAVFTIHQISAMLISKLKSLTESELGNKITDCVISVPDYFTDLERRALLDVCKIVDLNVLRLLNETTAVALLYGYYREGLSETKPKKVVFVDMGHSAVQASVCDIYQGNLKVLCSTWNYNVGGRNIDSHMAFHFSQEFKEKYNLDVLSNHRSIVRLLQECERLKKQLSANPQDLPLNVECIMNDVDVSSKLGRDEFEKMCSKLFYAIEELLIKLLAEAKLSPADIDSVEIVGGSTRIPAVKNIIKKVFGKEPSTTLNQDEAVARGCALQAALLSPSVIAREFYITDVQPYFVKVKFSSENDPNSKVEIIPRNHPIPVSKLVTCLGKEDVTLSIYQLVMHEVEMEICIGSFSIKNVRKLACDENIKIVIKYRINIHGIFNVVSAIVVEKDFQENPNLDQKAENDWELKTKNGIVAVTSPAIEEKRSFFSLKKSKKVAPDTELKIESSLTELSQQEISIFQECELQMMQQDACEVNRVNAKNALEEYVYEIKDKLSGDLSQFVKQEDRDSFLQNLTRTENWIYEEGAEEKEAAYREKIEEIKSLVSPILNRKSEQDQRSVAIADFQALLKNAHNIATAHMSGDGKYSHLNPEEVNKVKASVSAEEKWLDQQIETLSKLQLWSEPHILAEQIHHRREELRKEIAPVLCKPKAES